MGRAHAEVVQFFEAAFGQIYTRYTSPETIFEQRFSKAETGRNTAPENCTASFCGRSSLILVWLGALWGFSFVGRNHRLEAYATLWGPVEAGFLLVELASRRKAPPRRIVPRWKRHLRGPPSVQ